MCSLTTLSNRVSKETHAKGLDLFKRLMFPKKIGLLDSLSLSQKFREMPILGLFWRFFCLLWFPSERITHTTFHLLERQDIPRYRHLGVQDVDQLELLESSRIYRFNSRGNTYLIFASVDR